MNPEFCIVSDGSCDIPQSLAKENDIDIVHFLVSFNGSDYQKEGVGWNCQSSISRWSPIRTSIQRQRPPRRKIFTPSSKKEQRKDRISCVSVFPQS